MLLCMKTKMRNIGMEVSLENPCEVEFEETNISTEVREDTRILKQQIFREFLGEKSLRTNCRI